MKAKTLILKDNLNDALKTYAMILVLICLVVLFEFLTQGTFLSPRNFSNLIRSFSITGIVSMGMLLLIISGNIDLAVGSSVAICGGLAAILHVWYGASTFAAVLVALGMGVVIGLWQGFWVAYRGVPAFVCTLANQLMFRGLYLIITQGKTVGPLNGAFSRLSTSYLNNTASILLGAAVFALFCFSNLITRRSQKKYGLQAASASKFALKLLLAAGLFAFVIYEMISYNGIPVPVLLFIISVVIFVMICEKTRFGRRVFAVGGNLEAAKLSGINTQKIAMQLFVISGVLCAVGGVLLASRLDGAVGTAGQQYETDAISACVIGGASLSGGKGSISGAVVGILIISILTNGMSLLNYSTYYQYVVKGLVLILAVWFDMVAHKNR